MTPQIWRTCRICGNPNLVPVVDLGNQALSSVFPSPDAPDPSLSPLELIRCDNSSQPEACGLVQLRHTADLEEMYGTTYGYFSSISPTMVSHLTRKVDDLVAYVKPNPGDIELDIGCNDGTLLNHFGADSGLIRLGIDPSAEKFRSNYQPDIRVIYDFFSEEKVRTLIGSMQCKIITSIAMFYDLDDPLAFIRDISSLLTDDGVWALELSYLPLFLKQLSYDQTCHEHVTYLGLRQIEWMLRQCGLKTLEVSLNDMNGGSFYIYVGKDNCPYVPNHSVINGLI